jgi:hypothetical protein
MAPLGSAHLGGDRHRVRLLKGFEFAVAALVVGSSAATAYGLEATGDGDEAKPCRPTITCTADIVSPGEFQLESGASFAQGGAVRALTFPLLLHLGVTHWLEGQVGSNGLTFLWTDPHAQFLDNVFVGPKFHLLDQGSVAPSLSVSGQVSIPTFAEDGYVRETDLFLVGYASKDIGPIHVDWNIGLSVWRLAANAQAQGYTSLVVSKSLPADFGIEVEGYYLSAAEPAASRDGGLRGAVTYSARPWLVLDAGGDLGWFPSERGYTVFAGITVIPFVFWRAAKNR